MLRKLRVVVVVGAALLVAVVAGFVWYGRMVARRFKLDLPKRLGVNISQESHVVTLSRSVKGKTIFTVHAADQIQQKSGLIELHDVGIELFGRQDGRSDKISGQEFLFDQKNGVMTGVGEVLIDLAAPAGKAGKPNAGVGDGDEAKTVHVKTSGLTFNQEAQTARTDQKIDFVAGGLAGTAVGAEYDAKSGVVDLKSDVHVSGVQGNRPVVLTAGWAELQRTENLVLLTGAKYTAVGPQGGQSIAADRAEVHITKDGTPQEVDGQGHVVLTSADRGTMTGERMELTFNEAGKPKDGRIWGGVRYGYEAGVKRAGGTAQEVRVGFDASGEPAHVMADGGVNFNEQVADGARALTGAKVELGLVEAVKGKVSLRDAVATGGAALRMTGTSGKGRTATDVSGDELTAKFVSVDGKDEISTLDGMGHTVVHQTGGDGAEETSKGDTLAVRFREGAAAKGAKAGAAGQIEQAVQRGGVKIERKTAATARVQAEVQHASGDEAVYVAEGDTLTVTGGAQVEDATSELLADKVEMARGSGDLMADGGVRVSYVQVGGKGEPLYVSAARLVEKKAAGRADFFGGAGKDARMWQEGSQVQAPVLSFSQNGKDKGSRKLVAHGEGGGDADFVKAVLVNAGSVTPGVKTAAKVDSKGGAVRIVGHEMTYVEGDRTVEFRGRVKVQDGDAVMTAERAIAYLADKGVAAPGPAGAGAGLVGGKVERVVANGAVTLDEPGRKGTGEQLVYTASDRTFVLTGTAAAPPKVVDEVRGTTTGEVLRFRSGEDAVLISGAQAGQGKVHTETRVRPKQ